MSRVKLKTSGYGSDRLAHFAKAAAISQNIVTVHMQPGVGHT